MPLRASFCALPRPATSATSTALAAALALATTGPALAGEGNDRDDVAEMQRQIEQLREEVRELRGERETSWLDESRAEEVRDIVAEAMEDAEQRTELLGGRAGYENGFFIGDEDGDFHLRIGAVLKPRYIYNAMSNPPDGVVGSRGGFELTCARFSFIGHAFDPSWQYMFIVKYNNQGDPLVIDAWVRKDLGQGFSITAGQFKLPLNYEYLVSETRQQFVDRSLVSNALAARYSQGVMAGYDTDDLRLRLAFSDGANQRVQPWNTGDNPNHPNEARNPEYAFTGRAEVKLAGEWGDYGHFIGFPGTEPLVVLGAAGHFETSESGTPQPITHNTRWAVDALAKGDRWSIFAAGLGRHTNERGGGSADQLGFNVQGGYFINEQVELIGRYEWGSSSESGEDDLSLLTAGFNVFLDGHNLKWTTDAGYAFNGIGESWASPGLGWRTDRAGESGQFVVRTQLQLSF